MERSEGKKDLETFSFNLDTLNHRIIRKEYDAEQLSPDGVFFVKPEKYMLCSRQFNDLLTECDQFIKDVECVFKLCTDYTDEETQRRGRVWLIIMRRTDDTITNESRKNIVDINYAKCRGNVFLVLKIVDIENPKNSKIELLNKYFSSIISTTKYVVNERVRSEFDPNIDIVCSEGIHYYRSIKAAYCFRSYPVRNYTGNYFVWGSDGCLESFTEYTKGKKNGSEIKLACSSFADTEIDYVETIYCDNMQMNVTTHYKNSPPTKDILNGEHKTLFASGNLHEVMTYEKRKLSGAYVEYFDTDKNQVSLCGNYKNGYKVGKWISYYENNSIREVVMYYPCDIFDARKYNADGSLHSIMYNDEEMNGIYMEYHDKEGKYFGCDCELRIFGKYIATEKSGLCLWYDEMNNRIRSIVYDNPPDGIKTIVAKIKIIEDAEKSKNIDNVVDNN